MSNVIALPTPVSPRPPREMTNNERDLLSRQIKKIAVDQYYPLSRLMMRLALLVQEHPLEDVTLKDLSPRGYMFSATHPSYGVRWVFRLEGFSGRPVGTPVSQMDLLTPLQEGVKAIGSSDFGARFSYRFLKDLGDTLMIESVHHDDHVVLVTGTIQATPFALSGTYQHLPFRMTLEMA